jgi:signal transduction histidine kinase
MISTVLRNLLANAIKYSRPGGEIYISAEKTNKEVSVVVVDHGTGINQNILSKILSGDGNISTPGTMAETGTGLGLGLCKEFVERHGGRISVESKQGMGSKFSFIIPDNLCEKLNKS